MIPSPDLIKLYIKLKSRYPDKWYSSSACALLDRVPYLYDSFWFYYDSFLRDRHNTHQRRKRVRNYIRSMVFNRGYNIIALCSLTFCDDVLSSTSFSTRKRYVINFLNSFPDYMACIDFGKKNGREHYHAIILIPPDCLFSPFYSSGKLFYNLLSSEHLWSYGFSSYRPISCSDHSIYKVLNYAFKSSSYAFKSSSSSIRPFHKRNGFSDIPLGLF